MLALTGLAIGISAFLAASALIPIIRRRAERSGWVDRPGGRKAHARPTPYVGGFVLVLAIFAPVAAGTLLARLALAIPAVMAALPPDIALHAPGLASRLLQVSALAGAAVILALIGAADDRRGLPVGFRLAAEAVVALMLFAAGFRATLFLTSVPLEAAATVLWIVFLTNAVNFIDNQDGLFAATSFGISTVLFSLMAIEGRLFIAAFLLALLGALFAILRHNLPPARIFTGDAGTLPTGAVLAAMTLLHEVPATRPGPMPFVVPLLVMAVPLADGITVVVSRIRRGVSPFTAGRDHLSHRLSRRGVAPRRLAAIFFFLPLATGAPVVAWSALRRASERDPLEAPAVAAAAATLAAIVLAAGLRRRSSRGEGDA